MKEPISNIAFTPSVKAIQERMASRRQYARMEEEDGWSDIITPELVDFLGEVDSMYLATARTVDPTSNIEGVQKAF